MCFFMGLVFLSLVCASEFVMMYFFMRFLLFFYSQVLAFVPAPLQLVGTVRTGAACSPCLLSVKENRIIKKKNMLFE